MKQKILLLLSILLLGRVTANAQTPLYGNEWIDLSKTYYKFKVGADGAVRIPRSVLNAAGLPASVNGSNFILYREGVEVPLLASAEIMSSSDYLEFWGRKADGKFDKQLYITPTAQPDDRISLFTDTACYYLTYDAGNAHLRYTDATTAIPATPPAPPTYCIATVATHFKSAFSGGATYDANEVFTSGEFDEAEGYVETLLRTVAQPLALYQLATPNVVTGAPVNAKFNSTVVTQSFNHTHEVIFRLNNTVIADSAIGTSESKHFSVDVPPSLLQANNNMSLTMQYFPANSPAGVDRYGTSFIEIVYPRNFDLSGLPSFSCVLPASSSAQYVEFLNYSGTQPRLYDSAAQKFYNGDLSVAGKVRFYLLPSLQPRRILLFNAPAATSLALDKTIHFKDFGAAGAQANYVIITNKALRQGNNDYVRDYAAYRASFTGGHYDTTITDVADLYDAFAYGYDIHPLAIQNYLRFAYNQWTTKKPAYVTLIGRGILYSEYAAYRANPATYNFPIVPTYGDPGSDVNFVNFVPNRQQQIAIGRISVWNGSEIATYLSKIKSYEAGLLTTLAPPDVKSDYWKKQVLHIASGNDPSEQQLLENYLATSATIIQDTLTGYKVMANSNSGTGINPINNHFVDSVLNDGVQMLTYFGHASSEKFQYALNEPEMYHNLPRTPYFLALGCDVSQMFALNDKKTISERWMLQPTGGSTAVMAADNLGYTDFLSYYLDESYRHIAYKSYGATLGDVCKGTYNDVLTYFSGTGTTQRYLTQLENLIFAGDPALKLAAPAKPDYHIPSDKLSTIPGNVTTAADSFKLHIDAYNLGRAVNDTVLVEVRHRAPGSNKDSLIRSYRIANLFNTHTDFVWVPVNKITDLGLNIYSVTIDADNKVDEMSEANNTGTLSLFIYSDNLVPVYPKEFAIVYQQGVTLKASTLNPFRPAADYRLQLDTTVLFNSPLRQETVINSPGGVIKWKPNLVMQDSTVYYWRAAFNGVVAGKDTQWATSSFIYLAQGSPGWNQSHYYQYTRNGYDNETLDSDRQFRFELTDNVLDVHNKIKLDGVNSNPDLSTFWNTERRQGIPQAADVPYLDRESVQIMVIDSISGKWWINNAANTAGAYPPETATKGYWDREFKTTTAASRHAAMRYLDSIPPGDYVLIKNVLDRTIFSSNPSSFISTWQADAAIYGTGNTLYDAFKRLQFNLIDSFTSDRVFVFLRQKDRSGIPVTQLITARNSPNDSAILNIIIPSRDTHGIINSTVIGPSNGWQSLKWSTTTKDAVATDDSASVSIYGIDSLGAESLVYYGFSRDTSISFISSQHYPNIRLVWGHGDSVNHTPPQARYWRVLYTPVPEAALNPAAHLVWMDSLHIGQSANLSVAIENLTELPMDSMLVRYKVIDASGNSHLIANKRYRRLPGNDTLHATLTFDPAPYPGLNNLFVEANPDNDQREQYHPNNLGYLSLKVVADKSNPLLDVTFDGQHILDGDIVSSKPFISIRLKDENPYLPLNDTSLVSLFIRYPDDAGYDARKVVFDGDTAKFIPAAIGPNGKNEATIEYRPTFKQDGRYDLIVTAKDRSSNYSGTSQPEGSVNTAGAKYQSSFEVINKAMITNVLNYPNPFSTATAFVFTLTGSQIPSQFKIQILTVTGKVVREIMKNELGPLHIGRNITQYQWDGKDQYGQLLGNGVYMYRVVTSLAGNNLERFEGISDANTGDGAGSAVDKYFKNGWGKMYIMR